MPPDILKSNGWVPAKVLLALTLLKAAGYSSTKLRREKLLGESYMSQLRRGDMVSWAALDTICALLDCQPGDLFEYVKDSEEE